MPDIRNVRLSIENPRPPLRPPAEPENPLLQVKVDFEITFPQAQANGSWWWYRVQIMGADWPDGRTRARVDQHLFNLTSFILRRGPGNTFTAQFVDTLGVKAVEGTKQLEMSVRVHKWELDEDPPSHTRVTYPGDRGLPEVIEFNFPNIDDVFARVLLEGPGGSRVSSDSQIVQRFFDPV